MIGQRESSGEEEEVVQAPQTVEQMPVPSEAV